MLKEVFSFGGDVAGLGLKIEELRVCFSQTSRYVETGFRT
jgi:hypothetical protein